jgi:NADPH2:quinone reductase
MSDPVYAQRVHQPGPPEAMRWEQVALNAPGPSEARVRHGAVGVNFIDIYFRSGLYPAPGSLPLIPGNEGAGVVEAVGAGVTHVKPGDRVAYVGPIGSYATARNVPADRLVVLPDTISDTTAAGMMLKGMTVQYLLRRTHVVTPDTVMLFHAAAGGVGLIAGQWARHLGVRTIIGTVGSDDKAELARAAGYTHVINYRTQNFVAEVKAITGGAGCDVVYDSVGKDTFPGSLDCLRPLGLWVTFGNASGNVPEFAPGLLGQKGSLFMTRPSLFTYIAKRTDLEAIAADLFAVVSSGAVKIDINQTYPLAEASRAHADLEGRRTTGTTVLIP